MVKRVSFFLVSFFLFLAVLAFPPAIFAAGKLNLDPASGNVAVNANIMIKIKIDTGADKTTSADALINYNNSYFEVVSIENGGFYSNLFKSIGSDKIRVSAGETEPLKTKTGAGDLAILTLKAKQQGSTQLTFVCTPNETNESNISKDDINATDIIACNLTTGGSYTITAAGTGSSPTPTPTPTPTTAAGGGPTSTPTPTPTIPVTGVSLPTVASISLGALLLTIASIGFVLLK